MCPANVEEGVQDREEPFVFDDVERSARHGNERGHSDVNTLLLGKARPTLERCLLTSWLLGCRILVAMGWGRICLESHVDDALVAILVAMCAAHDPLLI
jgi:hypothetical protein